MDVPSWHLSTALQPAMASAAALMLALLSLSKPTAYLHAYIFAITMLFCLAFYSAKSFSPYSAMNDIFARFQLIELAHVCYLHSSLSTTDVLASARRCDPQSTERERSTISNHSQQSRYSPRDWRFAYKVLFNTRCNTNTLRQLITADGKQGEKLDKSLADNASYNGRNTWASAHSDQVALRYRVWLVVGKYALLCIYFNPLMDLSRFTREGVAWSARDYGPDRRTFFRHVLCLVGQSTGLCSTRTTIIRDGLLRLDSLGSIAVDYLTLGAFYEVFAIIAVSLKLDSPQDWPPMFGSIGSAVTVRGFWSCFWHRLIYNSFSAFAKSLYSNLGLQKGTQAARYTNNAIVFIMSGLMHWLVEYTMTQQDCTDLSQVFYFAAQFIAIVVEELFQKVFRSVESWVVGDAVKRHSLWRGLKRAFGYTWVACWFVYADEKIRYPGYYRCGLAANMDLEDHLIHTEL